MSISGQSCHPGPTRAGFRFGEHMIVALTGAPSSLRFLGERFGSPVT